MVNGSPPQFGRRAGPTGATSPGAGERVVPAERSTGRFARPTYAERPKMQADLAALNGAGGPTGPTTTDDGDLYSALGGATGPTGGSEKNTRCIRPQDFQHISGYTGHRPTTWAPHHGRDNFGIHPEGMDSKGESHIASWGRPAMATGAGFEGNVRLKEGAPKLNANGLFKTDIEDEIDMIGQSQQKMTGDTCFSNLRADRRGQTMGTSTKSEFNGTAQKLDKTLNKDPDGYSMGYATYKQAPLLEGSYPVSRHIPGFSGHIPGGVRS